MLPEDEGVNERFRLIVAETFNNSAVPNPPLLRLSPTRNHKNGISSSPEMSDTSTSTPEATDTFASSSTEVLRSHYVDTSQVHLVHRRNNSLAISPTAPGNVKASRVATVKQKFAPSKRSKNREAVKRCREKKKLCVNVLEQEVAELREENARLVRELKSIFPAGCAGFDDEGLGP